MRADFAVDLPDDVRGLGAPTAEFAVRRGPFVAALICGPLVALLGVGFIVMGIVYLYEGNPNRPTAVAKGSFIMFFLGGIALIGGAIAPLKAARSQGLRVFIFTGGVARIHREQVDAVHWNEIKAFFDDILKLRGGFESFTALFTGSTHRFTLERANGQRVQFGDSLGDVETLGDMIKEATLPYLLPIALEALQAGETVEFGTVGISTDGLLIYGELWNWDKIKEATFVSGQRGCVRVTEQGGMLSGRRQALLALGDIANPHVFEVLLNRVRPPHVQG